MSDAKGIAAVHVTAWRVAYRGLLPDEALDRLSIDELEKRWGERIAKPWGHIFVAEREGQLVGFAACGSSEDEDIDRETVGEIYVIYVHPEHWRQGHGAALLGKAAECLQDDGFEEIILWVLRGNQGAIRFYEASGFQADGASKVKQRTDGVEMPVVRYRSSTGSCPRQVWSKKDSL
jgi:ribosomal protein S18 acetylase RimI-like enzyme